MEQLIATENTLVSKRTSRELKCYNIASVYIGSDNRVIRYEYSFWDGKKCQTIKQNKLQEMLQGTWKIK
ncbi:MAG: hypothetical protein JWO92_1124 [Chitinophagaceae bacterium]|nr:hypothetical protein [Chitinophagaceae bacterium]